MKALLKTITALVLAATACFSVTACNQAEEGSNRAKLINIELSKEAYGVAVNKTDASLLTTVNEVLAENATAIASMIDAYESKDYTNDVPADNTYVDGVVTYEESMSGNDSYLVMATDAPFAPFEYQVGQNWGGIDVEIGKMIATELGKTLAIKQTAFDTICMAVEQGNADIGLAGLTITPARLKSVNFSEPYYEEAYQVVVVKENDTTFDGCTTTAEVEAKLAQMANGTKVGSQAGTTGAKYISGDLGDADGFGFAGYANLTLKPYETHAEAVRDMINGQVSFCIVDNLVAAQIVAQINAAA